MQNIIQIYKNENNTELEFRYNNPNTELIKNIIKNTDGLKSIEQSINFINRQNIMQIIFIDGIKKDINYYSKTRIKEFKNHDSLIPFKVSLSKEQTILPFSSNLSQFARIKLRLSIFPKELPDWRIDITCTKRVDNIVKNLKTYKNKILYKISVDDFINKANWSDTQTELEVEHYNTTNKNNIDYKSVDKFIISFLDQKKIKYDIYIRKLSNIFSKYRINTVKQLSSKVWEVNRNTYYNILFPNIHNYVLLDKADGIRAICIIEANTLHILSDTYYSYSLKQPNKNRHVFDSEIINNVIYIFDVLMFNGVNITDQPGVKRFQNIPDIAAIQVENIILKKKNMLFLTSKGYKSEIKNMFNRSKPYETDGLIFTPKNEIYKSKSWKWKPVEHMTIDFLVKKNNSGQLMLFCSITKKYFNRVNMLLVSDYNDIFPNTDIFKKIMPIQFCPSDNPNAYLYTHKSKKFKISELVNNIVEFRMVDFEWDPVRIRHDRKLDFETGIYFGNNYMIAEELYMSYKNPLTLTDLTISKSEYINNSYFKTAKQNIHRNQISYNSYVKDLLIGRFPNQDWAISLASGKGQDMFRLSKYNIKNCLFMDIDQQALSQIIMKKHSFQKRISKVNTRILTKQADLKTDSAIILKSIAKLVPVGKINLIIFNFAIHYFTDNIRNIRNILDIISKSLQVDGTCIITCFCGDKIFELLKDKDVWNDYDGTDVLKYSIKKKYKSKDLSNYGQQIDIKLPFSKDNYYTEYLVNSQFLIAEALKFNLELVESYRFCKFLQEYPNLRLLNESDLNYIKLHRYYIFKKI